MNATPVSDRTARIASIIEALVEITRKSGIRRGSITGVIAMLYSSHGSPCMGDIARKASVTTAALTGVIDSLEAAGLATRTMDPDDRRSFRISLTAHGRALVDTLLYAYESTTPKPKSPGLHS